MIMTNLWVVAGTDVRRTRKVEASEDPIQAVCEDLSEQTRGASPSIAANKKVPGIPAYTCFLQ